MFNSNKKDTSTSGAAAARNTAPSLLSSDLVINGNLESSGDMQVDGSVEGDIKSQKLTISASAVRREATPAWESSFCNRTSDLGVLTNLAILARARLARRGQPLSASHRDRRTLRRR